MTDPDTRAREVEAQMTDDERFALLVCVIGPSELWPLRDESRWWHRRPHDSSRPKYWVGWDGRRRRGL